VEGLWDEKREAHIGDLLSGVRERVQQSQVEAIAFACDLLSAAHKQYGDRIKRYIQTGNEEELGDLKVKSLKDYKEVVSLVMSLTGQGPQQGTKNINVKFGAVAPAPEPVPNATPIPAAKTGMTSEQAAKVLDIFDGELVELTIDAGTDTEGST
jgi:hypothetical protein